LFDGQRLEGLHDLGEEGVGDFRNDQPEDPAPPGNQCPGLAVGVVSKLGDGLPNVFSYRIRSKAMSNYTLPAEANELRIDLSATTEKDKGNRVEGKCG
jgi:hypothetical protein